ncbi:MAG: prepilin peptidase [Actinobacteria bacterium]|nr:MAG: prepilin peptidase [Actinomycetota bacterium]
MDAHRDPGRTDRGCRSQPPRSAHRERKSVSLTSESIVADDAPGTGRPDVARLATIAVAAFLSLLGAIRWGVHAETLVVIFTICTLVVISRHDFERRIIPNRIVVPAWIAVLLAQLALYPHHWVEWLVGSFGAGLFFLAVVLAYPAGMGMGDVKLALLIGAALGYAVVSALFLGTVAAGLIAAVMLFKEGSSARKRAIPLGPFLAGRAIVVLLFL